MELAFAKVLGVLSTRVGYAGGKAGNPTYELVCTGTTGHAEAVEVAYDPKKVSYEELLDVFWQSHDPTQLNRQGVDIGTQYRSAIFYHDEQQQKAAEASKKRWHKKCRRPIVTEIVPAGQFYEAEKYHQKYLIKKGKTVC